MADDLEAFLRRAAARRAQRRTPSTPPQTPRPAPPKAAPTPPLRQPLPSRQAVPPVLQPAPPSSVDARFARRAESIDREAEQLGQEVALADDLLATRLHETFDHELGELDLSDVADGGAPRRRGQNLVSVGQITAALRNPQSIAQAVVLAEILQRPVHRW